MPLILLPGTYTLLPVPGGHRGRAGCSSDLTELHGPASTHSLHRGSAVPHGCGTFREHEWSPGALEDGKTEARGPRLLHPVFIETICFHYFNQWCYLYSETLSKWNHVENAINE